MIGYLLGRHFITLALTIGFILKLRTQKSARDAQLRFFWLTLICCFLNCWGSRFSFDICRTMV